MTTLCVSCGCNQPENPHGDDRNITLADLQAAADAAGISLVRAAANILQTVTGTLENDEPEPGGPERRFVLGLAYQAGRDPLIAKGVDGGRDYFTPAELEKACWSFMLGGQQHGLFHVDGTEGAAQTVENGIYRNPIPWVVPGPRGDGSDDIVVRKGDWTQGLLLDTPAWQMCKDGKVNGLSPQGIARRRRVRPSA